MHVENYYYGGEVSISAVFEFYQKVLKSPTLVAYFKMFEIFHLKMLKSNFFKKTRCFVRILSHITMLLRGFSSWTPKVKVHKYKV